MITSRTIIVLTLCILTTISSANGQNTGIESAVKRKPASADDTAPVTTTLSVPQKTSSHTSFANKTGSRTSTMTPVTIGDQVFNALNGGTLAIGSLYTVKPGGPAVVIDGIMYTMAPGGVVIYQPMSGTSILNEESQLATAAASPGASGTISSAPSQGAALRARTSSADGSRFFAGMILVATFTALVRTLLIA